MSAEPSLSALRASGSAKKNLALLGALASMLIGLPLLGIVLAGRPLAPYLRFPPDTGYVAHAPFSWPMFWLLSALVIVCIGPFVYRVLRAHTGVGRTQPASPFPWWGWAGIAILALAWWLAWNRFSWFERWQEFTFSPLWLGYILLINALTWRRSGQCMLRNRPYYFIALFPLSAAFWWSFEYLNRFVQNWYYVSPSTFSPWEYFWYATLPFATVLPAVLGTREWLATYPRLSAGLVSAWRLRGREYKVIAALALALAATTLTAIGVWPDYFYAFLWLSPLLAITALQALMGRETIFAPLRHGDWRVLWQAALAALLCGLLWELWNYHSLAHWRYSVPFVQRFEIFHMPLLGYAGYLPFGLECLAIASLLERGRT